MLYSQKKFIQHYIFLGGFMSELISYISQFATTFFGVIESCFKLFFNDLPIIFGLRLGFQISDGLQILF